MVQRAMMRGGWHYGCVRDWSLHLSGCTWKTMWDASIRWMPKSLLSHRFYYVIMIAIKLKVYSIMVIALVLITKIAWYQIAAQQYNNGIYKTPRIPYAAKINAKLTTISFISKLAHHQTSSNSNNRLVILSLPMTIAMSANCKPSGAQIYNNIVSSWIFPSIASNECKCSHFQSNSESKTVLQH